MEIQSSFRLKAETSRLAACAPRIRDAIPIASRPHCQHLPRMTPGFGAGLVIETRSLPNLLVATLAILPSMSLIHQLH
jgi:hypothetical protein